MNDDEVDNKEMLTVKPRINNKDFERSEVFMTKELIFFFTSFFSFVRNKIKKAY